MITFAGILVLSAFPLVIFGFVMSFIRKTPAWLLTCGICGLVMAIVGQGIGYRLLHPTERDVLQGKAQYVETQHITGCDTIRTYKIEWKEKDGK